MGRLTRRVWPPMVLLAAGVGALVYGSVLHHTPVFAQVTIDTEVMVLEKPAPGWSDNRGPGLDGSRGGPTLPPPPPRRKKVVVKEAEEQVRPMREWQLVREVTVGGVARLDDGRLKLTYGPDEKGPALCPT